MISEVTLPELGENVDEAEVLAVLVSVGERVSKDQAVVEVETEKAAVEVPTPIAGVVTAIHVKPGDAIRAGQVIIELDTETGPSAKPAERPAEPGKTWAPAASAPAPASEGSAGDDRPAGREDVGSVSPLTARPVPAAPSVRRLARELGIPIADVVGRGPGGRISTEDVMRHARMLIQERRATAAGPPSRRSLELPDFTRYGIVERTAMSGVRRKTAQSMSRSWVTIPHVTQFDRADVTELEAARKHYASHVQEAGSRLTLTAVIIKVVAGALTLFPKFNASIDTERDEILYKQYVNIGVAVDTEHGLLVPVIRDVDKKSLLAIGRELAELSERARARKSRPEDLQGANLTVTNLGGLGTTYFAPLINWPEVAVVGIGRACQEAVYRDGTFIPRLVMPLSVSYDHRLIDGADAARFLRWVADALEHPLALALESSAAT